MLDDLIGWTIFFVLTIGVAVTPSFAVIQARRSFGVMGTDGPGGNVVRGIELLTASVYASVIIITGGRIGYAVLGTVIPINARTIMFYAIYAFFVAGFGLMGYGFKRHADGIIALRKHWLYEQGFHTPADKIEEGDDAATVD